MPDPLEHRGEETTALEYVLEEAKRYLGKLDESLVLPERERGIGGDLPERATAPSPPSRKLIAGTGFATRSSGPRFFHFVTGGTTPAALGADWLTSVLDQNAFSWISSPLGFELHSTSVRWLLDLFELPEDWGGALTTGATMANFVGLACGRRWWAEQHGVDLDERGFAGLPEVPIFSTEYIHASSRKALAMLGLGRDSPQLVDMDGLEQGLAALKGAPAIVIGNAGDVNTGDFDPIGRMADLVERHGAWLHVDGAFGLFARLTPVAAPLAEGIERADSVIADGHKWLNVPYDCGFAFIRDKELLSEPFKFTAAYLPGGESPSPEASRRARSLVVWATLRAYGRHGHRAMVERHLRLAQRLGRRVEEESELELLAPVKLNVVCFRHRPPGLEGEALDEHNLALGQDVLEDSRVFFGTTSYRGKTAFRPAIVNWRTTERDIDLIADVVLELGRKRLKRR